MEELKRRLESTEQDEERKKLMKDIELTGVKTKLAEAKYVSVYTIEDYKLSTK